MHIPQDNVHSPLYVVTSIFNSARYKSRLKLYRDFALYVRQAGAIEQTVLSSWLNSPVDGNEIEALMQQLRFAPSGNRRQHRRKKRQRAL